MQVVIPAPPGESGLTRIVLNSYLRLSLPDAKEFLSVLQRMPGGENLTMHWQADSRSPEVLVQPQPEHFEQAVERLLNEVGGFGPLGTSVPTSTEPVAHVAGRILVVTPDESIREVLVAFLSLMGFEPQSVSTGAEAIKLMRMEEYDLLVVGNELLEDMYITDVLRTVRSYVQMTTPVLFWTGGVTTELQDVAADLGTPLRVLNKPNDFQGFRRVVAEALEWRHMFRLRRHVRRYVAEEVTRRVHAIEVAMLGENWREEAAASDTSSTPEDAESAACGELSTSGSAGS